MTDDHSMNHHNSAEQQIDDVAVKRYFDSTRGGTAYSVSMMAHEHKERGRNNFPNVSSPIGGVVKAQEMKDI